MILKALKFCRNKGQINEWKIEGRPIDDEYNQWLTFESINLIVGKNATGKSKTIDAIRHIADLISGDDKLALHNLIGLGTGEYLLNFSHEDTTLKYYLDYKEGKILQEILSINGEEKLNRERGKLWYEGAERELDFQIDDDILAVTKRDRKQHSFFEQLYSWGKNLSHYRFGRQLGKDSVMKDIDAILDEEDIDLKNSRRVPEIFVRGERKFEEEFVSVILEDMKLIGYSLEKITTSPVKYFPVSAYGLNVKETDLNDFTDQREMSQGMFRALSLLIQLNYSLLSEKSDCILIDDIGEGLDYDRSKSLIELIIKKVKGSQVQVLMTTNDRFVMNKIPLEYWSVIRRVPHKSLFYNYKNSKDTFEDFKYTGLNNFDFLSSEFYISGFETSNAE